MFGPSHYVPILRWKQAERFALRNLHEDDRKRITPLIELTPTIFKSRRNREQEPKSLDPTQVLERQAKKLLEACGYCPFFFGPSSCGRRLVLRTSGKRHALDYLAEIGRNYKLALVPVTGLSKPKEYQSAVAGVD